MRIGIIGLGLLGRAIAARLIGAGHSVCGHDIAAAARDASAAAGVEILESGRAVAAETRALLLSLMTSDDRRRLFWGDQAVAEVLACDTLVLDTTTARPGDIVEDHARLAAQGVHLVDVCVSGSSETVRVGEALALVGDTREQATDYAPLLSAFTKVQFYFGAPGRGNAAKLVVNTVMGLNRLVLAEALALARQDGFDLGQMLEVLKQGDSYSRAMDTKGPKMVSGVYTPAAARLEQHAKDVALILEYAEQVGAAMPVSTLHRELLARVLASGAGALDNAAIF